jgi:hypothetical protein
VAPGGGMMWACCAWNMMYLFWAVEERNNIVECEKKIISNIDPGNVR